VQLQMQMFTMCCMCMASLNKQGRTHTCMHHNRSATLNAQSGFCGRDTPHNRMLSQRGVLTWRSRTAGSTMWGRLGCCWIRHAASLLWRHALVATGSARSGLSNRHSTAQHSMTVHH